MLIFGPSKVTTLPKYLGRERERHEILLIDSDDSMAGIKLVDVHELTQRLGPRQFA
jgi:hypothetical protein